MDVEIIVVDDGSDDRTAEIAEKSGCTVIRHGRSQGPVAAKNTALHVARGKYILFHDHDDRMRENALQTLYAALEQDKDALAAEAMVQDFFSPELTEDQKKGTAVKAAPYYGLFTGAILMHRTIFDAIGDFPGTLRAGEMLDWEHKMKQHGFKIKRLDFVSTDRRIHAGNFGKTDRQKEFKDYASLLRARLRPKTQ